MKKIAQPYRSTRVLCNTQFSNLKSEKELNSNPRHSIPPPNASPNHKFYFSSVHSNPINKWWIRPNQKIDNHRNYRKLHTPHLATEDLKRMPHFWPSKWPHSKLNTEKNNSWNSVKNGNKPSLMELSLPELIAKFGFPADLSLQTREMKLLEDGAEWSLYDGILNLTVVRSRDPGQNWLPETGSIKFD